MGIGTKYYHSCVNCDGVNTDIRNINMLPCDICLPNISACNDMTGLHKRIKLMEEMKQLGTLKNYEKLISFEMEFEEFLRFFLSKIKSHPTSLQKTWMKRIMLSKSFTIVAPTGVGKTTFGMITALWLSKEKLKSLLVFPTVILATQVYNKMQKITSNGIRIVLYHSKLKRSDREKILKRISDDDYDILVISSQFISRLILITASRGHVYDLVTNVGIHGVEKVNDGFYRFTIR